MPDGLLANNQPKLSALMANPLFGAGMGLLASRYNRNVNPFQAAMQGLTSAYGTGVAQDKKRQEDEDRAKRKKALEDVQRWLMQNSQPQSMMGPRINNLVPQSLQDPFQQYQRDMAWRMALGQ